MEVHEIPVDQEHIAPRFTANACPLCGSAMAETGPACRCPRCFFSLCVNCEGSAEPDG